MSIPRPNGPDVNIGELTEVVWKYDVNAYAGRAVNYGGGLDPVHSFRSCGWPESVHAIEAHSTIWDWRYHNDRCFGEQRLKKRS
jgi:hypothetical protein